jgi:hypothetical protein
MQSEFEGGVSRELLCDSFHLPFVFRITNNALMTRAPSSTTTSGGLTKRTGYAHNPASSFAAGRHVRRSPPLPLTLCFEPAGSSDKCLAICYKAWILMNLEITSIEDIQAPRDAKAPEKR